MEEQATGPFSYLVLIILCVLVIFARSAISKCSRTCKSQMAGIIPIFGQVRIESMRRSYTPYSDLEFINIIITQSSRSTMPRIVKRIVDFPVLQLNQQKY